MKKVLFTATVDSHIMAFHTPYLKYFKDNGYEVHVATNGTEKIPYTDVKHTVSFERSPFKPNNLKAIKQLKKIIDTEQFEIIHTHTPMGSVVTRLAALNARKKLKTRVIYTAHGFHFYKGAPLLNWLVFYPIEKMLARKTDTLITINKEDYSLAKSKFNTDVQYVAGIGIDPNKLDVKMSKSEKTALRKSLGLKDSDIVLMFPAELNKNKNQILLIRAMRELVRSHPHIHLLLPGKDNYKGKYQRNVENYGLTNNIHFLGYRKDIARLLQITDLAITSSLREGLPLNVIEAVAIGLPVIATSSRGTMEILENYSNGHIIEDNTPVHLASTVLRFKEKSERLQRSVEGRKITKRYSLDQVLPIIIGIYKKSS